MTKRRLLWVGQVLTETGYARVSENILPYLQDEWEVAVMGIGYDGDPHGKPYRIYRADRLGDDWGINRIHELIVRERPDMICLIMEPWNLMSFIQEIRVRCRDAVKIAAYCLVDGENMKPQHAEWLTQADVTIFPTNFALDEAKKAGFNGMWYLVPHGVNPVLYQPCNQDRARRQIGLRNILAEDAFVFGNVNENQPRKRLDLTIEAFARFYHQHNEPSNAYLYLHANKRSPVGWDLGQLATEMGVRGRIVAPAQDVRYGESSMKYVYNALNVQLTTSMGEGWGCTTMEGMACGIAQIVPKTAALGEWAWPVSIGYNRHRAVYSGNQQNVRLYEPDVDQLVNCMSLAWQRPELVQSMGQRGRQFVLCDEFRWSMVAAGFHTAFEDALQKDGPAKTFLVEAAPQGPTGTGVRGR